MILINKKSTRNNYISSENFKKTKTGENVDLEALQRIYPTNLKNFENEVDSYLRMFNQFGHFGLNLLAYLSIVSQPDTIDIDESINYCVEAFLKTMTTSNNQIMNEISKIKSQSLLL